jgi:hypothetical protein
MVMICRSEEFLIRQFGETRADCCKSLEAESVSLYLHFATLAVQVNPKASTWRENFTSSFR